MSSAIKRELAQVDSRLAQSRDELDTLVALISRQSTEMNGMTQRLTDRSETIAKTITDQRDGFADLSNDFETRMTALRHNMETQRDALNETTTSAAQRVDEASKALSHATKLTADHGDAITTAATTANGSITEAEARLSALSDRMSAQVDQFDSFYERRLTQLTDLSARLSDDKGLAETALYSQSEKLGAVDAQLEITESRLTDLLDHAAQVQAQLTARLSDIDRTLSDADQRSRAFTADIADRVTDSVAQTRREISIMESELRALQSRMDGAKVTERPLPLSETPKAAPTRVHLKPLDTDFPSLNLDDLAIPEAIDHDDATLDLIEAIDEDQASSSRLKPTTSTDATDLVRRPGEDTERVIGRGKSNKSDPSEKNWRWRDMLGSIDPIVDHDPAPERSMPPPKPAKAVERPGPGVPLRAPTSRATVRAPQPEGSDVVARLCEVKLAPSSVVDDGTIAEATSARQSGGEAAQSHAVFKRLNSPVIHLRGVLSADLEFRLRAEGFRRSYHSYLDDMIDASRLRAELASANGRAYLLCAAALSAS
jgi:predicted  nucleic acid-binding Zn-ribbon protein